MAFNLLRHATLAPRPLPEHPAHILSDLYSSLRALVAGLGTSEGREMVRGWVGGVDGEAEGVLGFWGFGGGRREE